MPEQITVPLFESAHEGFGEQLATSPNTYHRVLRGFDASIPSQLHFGDFITRITHATALGRPPVWAGEWVDTDGQTPAVFYLSGRHIMKFTGGASSEVGSSALAQISTGATFHDDGAGVAYLYIAEGTAGNIQRMNVAQTVTTGTVARDKLATISGSLYGSARPSTVFCGISFVSPGADPFTEANWSSTTIVGWPTTPINDIKQLRGIPVVLKPEGIFVYNRNIDLWENKTPAWEALPHPDNGRGAFSLGVAIIVPLGRGGAVIFDGYNVRDFSPYNERSTIDADTTPQVISVIASTLIGMLAVTSVSRGPEGGQGDKSAHGRPFGTLLNQKLTRRGGSDDSGSDVLGNRFFKTTDNEVTFTNYTTQVNDGSWGTSADLSSLSTAAAGDYFYVGHPRPWQGVGLYMLNTNGNASTTTAEIWNGSAWVAITITDFTIGESAMNLNRTGLIIFTQDPIELDWATRTLGTDPQACYYARFQVSAALDATVNIAETTLLPWRPSIDVTNFAIDGMDRAGCFPHLLLGSPTPGGGATWHDLGAVMTTATSVDEISCLLTAEVGGTYGNATNKLVAIGKHAIFLYENSLTEAWPFIAPTGLIEFGAVRPAEGKTVRLRSVTVEGRNFSGITNMWFYWRYLPTEAWSRKALGPRGNSTITISDDTGGTEFQWALGYSMSLDTVVRRPTITYATAQFEVLPTPVREAHRVIQVVERG